ncbi:hypothetical protein JXB01_01535 [Candidatus Micrarchaeota archaeon]|nr:hypothetical protein [Candidatus Micrarchaeota archaeon]
MKTAEKTSTEILNKQIQDPEYIRRMEKLYETKKRRYLDYIEGIIRNEMKDKDEETLLSELHTFLHLYIDEYALSAVTYIYAETLSDLLFKKLSGRFENPGEIIAVITHPEHKLFLNKQREEMMGIMELIEKQFGKEIFEKPPKEIKKTLEKNEVYEKLKKHSEKYFWIENNYKRKKVLSPEDFLQKMKDESASFQIPEDEINLTENREDEINRKRKEYLEKLNEEEKALAELLKTGAWIQDERKKCVLLSDHYLFTLIEEISKRTGIDYEILVNATPWEIPKILGGKLNPEKLKERGKNWFTIYYEDKGTHIEVGCMDGRKYNEGEIKDVNEFKGTPASPGKTRGKARIILGEHQFKNMEEGEILVAGMTRPDYVSIMKKAKGIITDEGGLTCHAAIVSREFKIPCIVGTHSATRLLKDGDEVELDADKGIVRILSRN